MAIEQARAIEGDRNVCVTPGKIASQCLELGLLDEIWIDLVPVLLGSGVPFFEELKAAGTAAGVSRAQCAVESSSWATR